MATLIPAQGDPRQIAPASGRAFTLIELQTLVGGYIEGLRVDAQRWMFINEDGKRERLPINELATLFLYGLGRLPRDDYIVGDAVLCSLEEAGGDDSGAE
jgi:hypothetical protein